MSALKKLIPSPLELGREAIIVLGGVVIAAAIIKLWPRLQEHVQSASITIKNDRGDVLF